MKDKEKANEIALKYASYDDTFQDSFDTAMEMAQWKEKQMIEKAIKWIEYYNNNGGCLFDGWKEDFKKEMEK